MRQRVQSIRIAAVLAVICGVMLFAASPVAFADSLAIGANDSQAMSDVAVGDQVVVEGSQFYFKAISTSDNNMAVSIGINPAATPDPNTHMYSGSGLLASDAGSPLWPQDHAVVIPKEVTDIDGRVWQVTRIEDGAFGGGSSKGYVNHVEIADGTHLEYIGSGAFGGLSQSILVDDFCISIGKDVEIDSLYQSSFTYIVCNGFAYPEGSELAVDQNPTGYSTDVAAGHAFVNGPELVYPTSFNGSIYQFSYNLGRLVVKSPYSQFCVAQGTKNNKGKVNVWPTSLDQTTKLENAPDVFVWADSVASQSLSSAAYPSDKYSLRHMAVLEDNFTIDGITKPTDVAEPYGAQASNVKLNNADENVINGTTEIPDGMLSVMNGDEVEWTLAEGTDYTVNYYGTEDATTPLASAPDTAGIYWVEFVGNEKTAWGTTPRYKLALSQSKTVIGDSDVDLAIPEGGFVYDGAAKEPNVTVTHEGVSLTAGIDYEVAYVDNTDVGTAAVTITGIGAYAGAVSKTFEIAKCPLADSGYVLSFANNGGPAFTYCGSEVNPQVVLAKGFDSIPASEYSVSYTGDLVNCTLSDASEKPRVIVTMNDDSSYVGTASLEFTISQADISTVTTESLITGETSMGNIIFTPANNTSIGASAYTGSAQSPDIPQLLLVFYAPYGPGQVKLGLTTEDYKADAWTDNSDAGEASVTLHGQGNFKGDLTLKYTIEPAPMEDVEVAIDDQVWTGGAIEPIVSAKLGDYVLGDDDYSVTYEPSDLTDVGTVQAALTGKSNFKGSKIATFMIRKSLEGADVQVADQDYTGNALTPDVTVKLGDSTLEPLQDYTVSYDNNTNVGTATVTVTGEDNYMGTVTKEFAIKASAEDQAAIDAFASALDAIGIVNADSKPAVDAARAAYDALSDVQKALVSAEAVKALEDAEQAYATAVADKAAADKAKSDADAKAKADAAAKAAALAAASTVNTATLTPAQVKKASDLGATTITLGPKVKKIAKGAFKGTNIKTIVVKTKKLKKKSVKGSLKGSKVKTVKVQVGSKKANKKVVKKYKKIFTKKNAGKKAKVR